MGHSARPAPVHVHHTFARRRLVAWAVICVAFAAFPQSALAAIVSDAVCNSEFAWMNNNEGQSPCLVTAYLEAACGDGTYEIKALTPGTKYCQPNGPGCNTTAASACACSWAAYNLFAACTACQNFTYMSWSSYSIGCPPSVLQFNTYFPNIAVSKNTSIPYWASVDPSHAWSDTQFNVQQAKALGAENKPDVPATPVQNAPKKKSVSAAAIAGAAVGAIVLIFAAICGFLLYRRWHPAQPRDSSKQQRPPLVHNPTSYASTTPLSPLSTGTEPGIFPPMQSETVVLGVPMPLTRVTPAASFPSAVPSSVFLVDPFVLTPPAEGVAEPGLTSPEGSMRSLPMSTTTSSAYHQGHDRKYSKDSTMTAVSGTVTPHHAYSRSKDSAMSHGRNDSDSSGTARPAGRYNPPAYSPPTVSSSASVYSDTSVGHPVRGGRPRGNTISESDEFEEAPPAFQATRPNTMRLATQHGDDVYPDEKRR